jgi:hypothetical protein
MKVIYKYAIIALDQFHILDSGGHSCIILISQLQVDDLRCILHNLGKFLSNKDVKVRCLSL